jgi:hypothetical protein
LQQTAAGHLSPGLQIPAGHSLHPVEQLLFAINIALVATKMVAPIKIIFFIENLVKVYINKNKFLLYNLRRLPAFIGKIRQEISFA